MKKRKLMKFKKDVIVRREWGSSEKLIIHDFYVPEPSQLLMYSSQN